MSKYDPSRVMCRERQDELEVTFAEIERLLGAMVPKRTTRQQWWANTTDR